MQPEVILQKLTQHIREEFEEAPGLRLTVSEAARFWGLDVMTCEQVLGRLRRAGFLIAGADARYGQADVPWEPHGSHDVRVASAAELVERHAADRGLPDTRRRH